MSLSDKEIRNHVDDISFYTDGVSIRVLWHGIEGKMALAFDTEDDRILNDIFFWDVQPDCERINENGKIWRKMSHTGCDWGLLRQAIAALNFNKEKDDRILPLIEYSRPIWERNTYEPIPEPIPHPDIDGENA